MNNTIISKEYLLSRGFRVIGKTDLYAVSLPSAGVELIADLHGNLWMEYWRNNTAEQSVGFGKYTLTELTALLNILLR